MVLVDSPLRLLVALVLIVALAGLAVALWLRRDSAVARRVSRQIDAVADETVSQMVEHAARLRRAATDRWIDRYRGDWR
jgi:Flp pilus assembly protein TadB